ncbi:MAG: hypothetical protein JRJ29_14995 [Deltaproteobacteria bacterium]|nr:hypothetical protein [Deltaproteobacteria bacterium]
MSESKVITVPASMSLKEQIAEVNRQITKWLESLNEPFESGADLLRLKKCERKDGTYTFHYEIIERKKASASRIK